MRANAAASAPAFPNAAHEESDRRIRLGINIFIGSFVCIVDCNCLLTEIDSIANL